MRLAVVLAGALLSSVAASQDLRPPPGIRPGGAADTLTVGGDALPGRLGSKMPVAYTPTLSCPSGALTAASATGSYSLLPGKLIAVSVSISITTNGNCGGYGLIVSLPRQIGPIGGKIVGKSNSGAVIGDLSGFDSSVVVQGLSNGSYPGSDGSSIMINGTYIYN